MSASVVVLEFSNLGSGDGSFITRHLDLLQQLKQFPRESFTLDVCNIPGARAGGYNYRLTVKEKGAQEVVATARAWMKQRGICAKHFDFTFGKFPQKMHNAYGTEKV